MPDFLRITIRFLRPLSHARGDGDLPEWPPSPLRVFQALVAASAGYWNERTNLATAAPALRWLERLDCSEIIAPVGVPSTRPYRLYVPDNVADKVAASWHKGNPASIADYRIEKDFRPVHLAGDEVHYLYPLTENPGPYLAALTTAARHITHVGWGVDVAVGDATMISAAESAALDGCRWQADKSGVALRCACVGSLDDMIARHAKSLGRLVNREFRPTPPLRTFRVVHYRSSDAVVAPPFRVFELRKTDGTRFRYPQSKVIHIAGMLRHLAIKAMSADPPPGTPADWSNTYIAGHCRPDSLHRQISYVPLPSIGHEHADPGVRRVMLIAPPGDEAWLDYLARRMAGRLLEPVPDRPFPFDPPLLVPVPWNQDKVVGRYTRPANVWASVTPVILPGHDDHKPGKCRKLIEKALAQSGIEQPCEFEWSAYSRFPKSLSAHKYDSQRRPTGYFRPDHLPSETAVHVTLRFRDGLCVPGPLVVGAGRHCGFGLMAAIDGD